jgi:hypothetical protein
VGSDAEMRSRILELPKHSPTSWKVVNNYNRHPNGRSHSLETRVSAQQIHAVASAALDFISQILPLPDEALLNSRFAGNRRVIAHALQDLGQIGELTAL